jgi:hypothetical protein
MDSIEEDVAECVRGVGVRFASLLVCGAVMFGSGAVREGLYCIACAETEVQRCHRGV